MVYTDKLDVRPHIFTRQGIHTRGLGGFVNSSNTISLVRSQSIRFLRGAFTGLCSCLLCSHDLVSNCLGLALIFARTRRRMCNLVEWCSEHPALSIRTAVRPLAGARG